MSAGALTGDAAKRLVAEAIEDLVRESAAARTTVQRVVDYVRVINGVALTPEQVRLHIEALQFNLARRVSDGARPPPVQAPVVAAPRPPARITVTLVLDVEDGGGASVVRAAASPAHVYEVRASAEYRGADPALPLHVFLKRL